MPHRPPVNLESILLEGIEVTPNCLGVINSDKEVIYCNQHYASIFGATKEQAIGKKSSDLLRHAWEAKQGVVINTNDFEQWLDNLHKLHTEKALNQYETDLLDGRWFKMTRINLDSGNIIIMGVDITLLKQAQKSLENAHQHIESLVNTDQLTGVHNRRSYNQLAKQECARAIRFDQPLSLLVIDIDYFKVINDNFGHDGGDSILKQFSQICTDLLRQSDSLYRIGGEEFTIILPMTDDEGAMIIAERVRDHIAKYSFHTTQTNKNINVTVSIGVSSLSAGDNVIQDLFSRADKAMYCAKRGGRNQVQLAQGE
ncbi:sensor domain-containing diguanylate cyclase [Shewanella polaris]|uniref:diguanylate cyclase n=1 Tax=Shewanella polaris TaxID=2588449 RepID=A0A4Y5YA36_9GAMM|nr:sensor domain-containing diguanylate cyclase [Shewanella polaris]QDE29642.1 GGDEF domain-containing protein [Shewanella polaris]